VRQYCDIIGWNVVGVYSDVGSGWTLKRPTLRQLILNARKAETRQATFGGGRAVLLVDGMARLTCDPAHLWVLMEELGEREIDVVSTDGYERVNTALSLNGALQRG
jgi:DNA invertase Pin-like site-specific DNA recombinase